MFRLVAVLAMASVATHCATGGPPLSALAISPDGHHVVTGSVEGLQVLDAATLSVSRKLATRLEQINAASFSPAGASLAAVGGVPGESGEIEVFRWPGGERIGRWDPAVDVLYALDWMPDGKSLVAVGFDETAWRALIPQQKLAQWDPGHSRPITSVCLMGNPDSDGRDRLAVTAGIDQSLRVFDFSTQSSLRSLHNHTAPVHALAPRPAVDSPLPVVASISDDRTVRFWQPTIGRMMRFARLPSVPLCLTWTPDESRLIVGCADGQLRVIDPQTAVLLSERPVSSARLLSIVAHPHREMAFVGTADGEVLQVPIAAE